MLSFKAFLQESIQFVKPGRYHSPHGNPKLIEVDVDSIDSAWKQDTMYVGPNGTNAIRGRYEEAINFIKKAIENDIPIEASVVTFDLSFDNISFADGRHRFAALRDMGIKRVAVAYDPAYSPKGSLERFLTVFNGVIK